MSWQLQYQSREHARFYADKRDATLLRRISNYFERRMIRRALRRVQRKAAFRTALDCASGTGRLLPVLAKFDVSVIAMDTAEEMLEEGRRYHHLFREPPQIKVGSALEIPLPDQSVDVVLCSRLLHHFPDAESRVQIFREFARVAKVGVVVSFFDAVSYRGWRRNRKEHRPHRDHGRYAISRKQCRHEAELAGLEPLGMNALLRFHTEVTAAAFLVSGGEVSREKELGWLRDLGLSSVESLMNFRPAGVAALSNSSDTFRVDCDESGPSDAPRQIFVKRYRYHGWGPRFRGFFRGTFLRKSRARLEFELLSEMRRRGVPSVVPMTFVEDRRLGFLRSAALITEGQPNAEPLPDYFSKRHAEWDAPQRRKFIGSLAKAIAQLHEAGVQHGGLFWRNILVTESDNGWSFTFLDPSRRCQFFSGPAPIRARVADLSDLAASGTALQWSVDFNEFMGRYCDPGVSQPARASLTRAVRSRAKTKAEQEDHRMVIGSALSWLQRRVERAASSPRQATFASVDSFFDTLRKADLRGATRKRKGIHFEIGPGGPSGETRSYDVALEPDGVIVKEGSHARADLMVRADADAWLSIVNARPEAIDAIRAGRLSLQGDTQPLAALVKWLDAETASSSPKADDVQPAAEP